MAQILTQLQYYSSTFQVIEAFKHEFMTDSGINSHTIVKPVSFSRAVKILKFQTPEEFAVITLKYLS